MFVAMVGFCFSCGEIFSFNPHKVPSLLVDGVREAICRSCAERWNELHPELAKPIQEGAYDPMPAEEL